MKSKIDTTGDQITIIIDRSGATDATKHSEEVLDALEKAVNNVLGMYRLETEIVKVIDGHVYAAIDPDCPVCGDRLKLGVPALDSENGATAKAACDCGWSGQATYRLIDVEDPQIASGDAADQKKPSYESLLLTDTGSVRHHDLQPHYIPY